MKQERKTVDRRSNNNRTRVANKLLEARVSIYRNFNTVENSDEAISIIKSIATAAIRSAASEAQALRMPKTYASSDKIIKETADGEKTVIATARELPHKKYFRKYTIGTIMHAVKK